ncbi:toxin-antitoxin system, antitoxin component, ribbon-helix-helix domain protein [Candidatus Scalindua japonica]|uniref:Toxin-antitoxin system, antitoxin component, ribbon-helix-helix domain protein n=2 Tax=Candidatus Scalindua japonica TaxID=1284222 RepID=A0A286TX70_9BACT|nr:toxin-antitoxin system, antitoxin component, ribbon-helix-helix domain protein [Candidatus Scalindua japonica]
MKMKNLKLDKEEKALLESVEKGEWVSIKNKNREISKYIEMAKSSFKKDRRINLRMSSKDVIALQTKALEEGIPYQTLMSSVLHKFVTGRLIEKKI